VICFAPPFLCFVYDYHTAMKHQVEVAIFEKNKYLEYAGKIIRHDMHSGINTYIPRGLRSLKRRLPEDLIVEYKLDVPLKLIEDGLTHTQRVYEGVKAFTNLVREDSVLETQRYDLKEILSDYLSMTAYSKSVLIDDLAEVEVNRSLFCTAIDNLIRNGLKYNDSKSKLVTISMDNKDLLIVDNGRGIGQYDFDRLSQPYVRKTNQVETGSGLGLNITKAILQEHGFTIQVEKLEVGTKIAVRIL